MTVILALIGILGILMAGGLCMTALTSNGLGVAIVLPAALVGVLLSFMLLGVSEMLRALWKIERHLRNEAADKAALKTKLAKIETKRAA